MRSTELGFLAVLAVTLPAARAGTIDALYSFGDSLSDTGNVYLATGGTLPGTPYFPGRFSNGPIWIDYLARSLGLPITPSLAGGTNFAYGGADTGVSPVHPTTSALDLLGLTGQIAQFTAAHPSATPTHFMRYGSAPTIWTICFLAIRPRPRFKPISGPLSETSIRPSPIWQHSERKTFWC